MNLNTPAVVMFCVGAVLLYAARHNQHPMDTIRQALGKPQKEGTLDGLAPKSIGGKVEKPATTNVPGTVWTTV